MPILQHTQQSRSQTCNEFDFDSFDISPHSALFSYKIAKSKRFITVQESEAEFLHLLRSTFFM